MYKIKERVSLNWSKTSIMSLLLLFFACIEGGNKSADFNYEVAKQIEQAAWEGLPEILAGIEMPQFSEQTFNVLDFGAKTDSIFNSQKAIQAAIDSCHSSGGGMVLLPAGRYFSQGPIQLKSGVNLHLQVDAYLSFSDEPTDYLPLMKVRWEGTVCWNWSPLIYANGAHDIGLTGLGTIDGNGREWSMNWREKQKPDKDVLRQMGNDQIPEDQRVFGNGFLDQDGDGQDDGFGDKQAHFLRPTLIEIYQCEKVLIRNLSLKNSPFWTVHPVFSRSVTITGLQIEGGYLNDDGINPDSCTDVLIEDCYIATEDDAISIKAGRDQDAWERPGSKRIVVRNCELNSGVNAFCIGSEMSGGVEDIFVENCRILSGRHGLNFKCNLDRGGQVQRIFFRQLRMDTLQDALFIFRMDYHGYRGNHYPTQFNDFYASDIECKQVEKQAFKIVGVADAPIRRVLLDNITIHSTLQPMESEYAEELLFNEVSVNGQDFMFNK